LTEAIKAVAAAIFLYMMMMMDDGDLGTGVSDGIQRE
jgi:hypothetical protein